MDSKELVKSIESSMDALAKETDKVKISASFLAYLNSLARFHNYSYMNQILIWYQKPKATRVAGFKTWQNKFGRTVKKGEKGIAILAPIKAQPKKAERIDFDSSEAQTMAVNEDEDKAYRPSLYFRVVYVFDVSQTEGKELPEEPNWHDTEKNNELESLIVSFAKGKGIKVEYVDDLGGADGCSTGGKIQLLHDAGTRTLIHELAHELLHKKEQNLSRQQKEIEADAVAYAVGQHFNINSDASPNYLALWKATGKEIRECLYRIRDVVVEIICAVDKPTPEIGGEA